MIEEVTVENYRSFLHKTSVKLSPFTLVVGPNGSGKSNLLRLIDEFAWQHNGESLGPKHINGKKLRASATVKVQGCPDLQEFPVTAIQSNAALFCLDPATIGKAETVTAKASVTADGSGAVAVLDMLRNGDRDDLFEKIELQLRNYIPTIEKLSTTIPGDGQKLLQVREKHLDSPLPVADLSEGTKLILLMLTILFQESPPKVILLEDIDRGLHPRLFQRVVEMFRDIVRANDVQIIATTHNPYFIDQFNDDESSVVLVEKKNGSSELSLLSHRLEDGDKDGGAALGELWYGGFLGGIPDKA